MKKLLTILLTFVWLLPTMCLAQETYPFNGVKDKRSTVHAFTNANIFTENGKYLENATLVVQEDKIISVGTNVSVPSNAVVHDLNGLFIYPSLIDPYTSFGIKKVENNSTRQGPQYQTNKKGAYHWNEAVKPETSAHEIFVYDKTKAKQYRDNGFAVLLTHSNDGVVRGSASMVALDDEKENEIILKDIAAACYSFQKGNSRQSYPSSQMGSIALLRQTYLDADWYGKGGDKEEFNISLDAFNKLQNVPQIFLVQDKLEALRASKIANEFGKNYIIKGGGDEYLRSADIKSTGSSFIIPVNFPKPYDVKDPYESINVSLSQMKHWELAPSNAKLLNDAGINFVFTAHGLKSTKDFSSNVEMAIERGLNRSDAVLACTKNTASLFGMDDQVGSIKVNAYANFIVCSDSLFKKENKILQHWVMGSKYNMAEYPKRDIRGVYNVKASNNKNLIMQISGNRINPTVTFHQDTLKHKCKHTLKNGFYNFNFSAKLDGKSTPVKLTGTYDVTAKEFSGKGQLSNGTWFDWTANYVSADTTKTKDNKKPEAKKLGEVWYPNMAYGFNELPSTEKVLFKNATVWTNEKAGILEKTDVLIQDGVIKKIGQNLSGGGATEIDASGMHLTCGIIDEHSHIAISKGVNEGTQASSAEVRIGDVINSDNIHIYRQLAGGVTTSQLLHGSANPIGGQSAIIKLRWGSAPEDMKMKEAVPFIKFALGENVKQSNWGDRQTIRYPQTRMGVEQVYVDGFTRAREYEKALASGKNVRRDLDLEALSEILNSERFITCHSYQQGEITMLMRVAEQFDFKLGTFTHILEGYKVADKMKEHGVGASTFSDWWGYKYEVIEAIPFNAAILVRMGVVTAINSDDAEMGRRLNQEAAKSIKYGGLSEEEAWKLCTLNPAILLKIDKYVGSIKEGKHADVVLWTDNPLSVYAKVEQTYVDGKLYFDSKRDAELRKIIQQERARLISAMNGDKTPDSEKQRPKKKEEIEHKCNDDEHKDDEYLNN
ncbi:MAG: amidohydrolase family protein [Bacteroidia bacterium]|nr:amidohydrolase family protein [Bacteroidia bacterium]